VLTSGSPAVDRSRTIKLRVLAALLLLLQALSGPLLGILHADQVDDVGIVHIEAGTGKACPPSHDHNRCQICRTHNLAQLPRAKVVSHAVVETCVHSFTAGSAVALVVLPVSAFNPRAPPVV
jgi:hypothetical protein